MTKVKEIYEKKLGFFYTCFVLNYAAFALIY